jgi:hypothetical protein
MDSSEYVYVPSLREQPARPSNRFKRAAGGICFPSEAFPASNGYDAFDPGCIRQLCQLRLLSQLASHRSGSLVNATPPEQLDPNIANLNAFPSAIPGLRRGMNIPSR